MIGPIEFLDDPDADWRYVLEDILKKEFGITSINPVTVSFLVGKDIKSNMLYAAKLKAEWRLEELKEFMDKIWPKNKESVDIADALVTWVRSEDELLRCSRSGGTIRELARAADQKKPSFLICPVDLTVANSHFLHLFLEYGKVFKSLEDLICHLKTITK